MLLVIKDITCLTNQYSLGLSEERLLIGPFTEPVKLPFEYLEGWLGQNAFTIPNKVTYL